MYVMTNPFLLRSTNKGLSSNSLELYCYVMFFHLFCKLPLRLSYPLLQIMPMISC